VCKNSGIPILAWSEKSPIGIALLYTHHIFYTNSNNNKIKNDNDDIKKPNMKKVN
jgi:hypothetical protein